MREIGFDTLRNTLDSNGGKKAIITFHSMGDTDSVSSAFALSRFFKDSSIATPDFITGNAKRILERLGFESSAISVDFESGAELAVMLDVNNFEDCGPFKEKLENFKGLILIIDHHTPSAIGKENVMVFNNESYNSAASIVYDLLKADGIEVDSGLAKLLATGIISDSAELRNAFPDTFIQIGDLLKKGGTDYQSLLLEMQHVASAQNREEFINDLFNAKIARIASLLVLYGAAQSHANKIADDAIKIGADASVFYTVRNGEISFSARMRPPLDRLHGINLGRIMKAHAYMIGGNGGGHPCAAGAYGSNASNPQEFMGALLEELRRHIDK
ncbi:MAG: DHH family phosphoesterase [Candidatus Micrarchaeaceae archaeon]